MGKASRGKRDGDEGSRRDRVDAMREADEKAQRRRNLMWALVAVVAVAIVAGFTYSGHQQPDLRARRAQRRRHDLPRR